MGSISQKYKLYTYSPGNKDHIVTSPEQIHVSSAFQFAESEFFNYHKKFSPKPLILGKPHNCGLNYWWEVKDTKKFFFLVFPKFDGVSGGIYRRIYKIHVQQQESIK